MSVRLLRRRETVLRRLVRVVHRKRLRHPEAGLLTLDHETLHAPAAPGETGPVVHVFSAGEDSEAAVALGRLATAVMSSAQLSTGADSAEHGGPR